MNLKLFCGHRTPFYFNEKEYCILSRIQAFRIRWT